MVTDYNDDLMSQFFRFLACILSSRHVTVCVCHAELKSYLLTNLWHNTPMTHKAVTMSTVSK